MNAGTRRSRLRALAVPAVLLAVLALGCGGDPGSAEQAAAPAGDAAKLSGEERRLLASYDREIQAHCLRVARTLIEPSAAPSPRQEERAFAAADGLIALATEKPAAPLGAGQDTRLYLADVIENLGGSNCDPRLVTYLAQGLAAIPAPR